MPLVVSLEEEYEYLEEEISLECLAEDDFRTAGFFKRYAEISADNGDTPDLNYCPVLKPHLIRGREVELRLDGYALDRIESEDRGSSADFYLAISDYRQNGGVEVVNMKDVEAIADKASRFFRMALDDEFVLSLEEDSPEFEVCNVIREFRGIIDRVRVIVFTNAELRTRKNTLKSKEIEGVTVHINALDLARYVKISNSGPEAVEVDFVEDFGGPISCLEASEVAEQYASYLFAIPGTILAEVYSTFGNRILEQNVRTYLQNRTKVNKGILKTIGEEPEMFFAYNNGLTATASNVELTENKAGVRSIARIEDFQIVNGGQTTASLLYARDSLKHDLDRIFVQVKLSQIKGTELADLVPRISEYANTQNKVSLADLTANSPFHIRVERLANSVSVPVEPGEMVARRWFYERARGQYKALFSYKKATERKKIEVIYPRTHLVEKTDLAKFELAYDMRPHQVCEGAQKCFLKYNHEMSESAQQNPSETWFKRAMSKAILFRTIDREVTQADWYKEDRGLKSQTVAYTISSVSHMFRERDLHIDLDRIWSDQVVPEKLVALSIRVAKKVKEIIGNPPGNVANPSEFAKREFCWTLHVKESLDPLPENLTQYGLKISDYAEIDSLSASAGKIGKNLNEGLQIFEAVMADLARIRSLAETHGFYSPKNSTALNKLERGNLNLTKSETNSLKLLLERVSKF